jgi:hypothetical protein
MFYASPNLALPALGAEHDDLGRVVVAEVVSNLGPPASSTGRCFKTALSASQLRARHAVTYRDGYGFTPTYFFCVPCQTTAPFGVIDAR